MIFKYMSIKTISCFVIISLAVSSLLGDSETIKSGIEGDLANGYSIFEDVATSKYTDANNYFALPITRTLSLTNFTENMKKLAREDIKSFDKNEKSGNHMLSSYGLIDNIIDSIKDKVDEIKILAKLSKIYKEIIAVNEGNGESIDPNALLVRLGRFTIGVVRSVNVRHVTMRFNIVRERIFGHKSVHVSVLHHTIKVRNSGRIFVNSGGYTMKRGGIAISATSANVVNKGGKINIKTDGAIGIDISGGLVVNNDGGSLKISKGSDNILIDGVNADVLNSADMKIMNGGGNIAVSVQNSKVVNNGNINIYNGQGNIGIKASQSNVTNNGNVSIQGGSDEIAIDSENSTVINLKNVSVSNTTGSVGILSEVSGSSTENLGNIVISSGTENIGMESLINGLSTNFETINITGGSDNVGMQAGDGGTVVNDKNGTIDLESSDNIGMVATGDGVANNSGNILLNTSGTVGMEATNGGTVINNGNIEFNVDNVTAIKTENSIVSIDKSMEIDHNNNTIIDASNSSDVFINDDLISSDKDIVGSSSIKIDEILLNLSDDSKAFNGATLYVVDNDGSYDVKMNGSSFTNGYVDDVSDDNHAKGDGNGEVSLINSNNSYAIYETNGSIFTNTVKGKLTFSGNNNSYAVYEDSNSSTINDGLINITKNDNSTGIYLTNSSTISNNGNINFKSNSNSYLAYMDGNNNIFDNNGNVVINNNSNVTGIYVTGSSDVVNHLGGNISMDNSRNSILIDDIGANITNMGNIVINNTANSDGIILDNNATLNNNGNNDANSYINTTNSHNVTMITSNNSTIINGDNGTISMSNSKDSVAISLNDTSSLYNSGMIEMDDSAKGYKNNVLIDVNGSSVLNDVNGELLANGGDETYLVNATNSNITNAGTANLSDSTSSYGFYLRNSTLNSTGNILVSGEDDIAIYGSNSTINNQNGIITVEGSNEGVVLTHNSNLTNDGTVALNKSTNGTLIDASNSIVMNNGNISVADSKNSDAIYSEASVITNNANIIIDGGSSNYGVYANNSSIFNNGDIYINSDSSYAIYSDNSTVDNGANITLSKSNSYGIYAVDGSNVTNSGQISLNGNNSVAIYVNSSNLNNTGYMMINGFNNTAEVVIDSNFMNVGLTEIYGYNDKGILSSNSTITNNNTMNLKSSSSSSYGIYATDNSIVTNSEYIDVSGTNNTGIYANNSTVENANHIYLNSNNSTAIVGTNKTTVESMDIQISGINNTGIDVSNNSVGVSLDDIYMDGSYSTAMVAHDDAAIFNFGYIEEFGNNSIAMQIDGGSSVGVNKGNIIEVSSNSIAIDVNGGTFYNYGSIYLATLDDNLVVSENDSTVIQSNATTNIAGNNYAIVESNGANVNNYADIEIGGNNSIGVYTDNSTFINDGIININDDNEVGIFAVSNSNITNNGTINMGESDSIAIEASSGSTINNNGNITMVGDEGEALKADGYGTDINYSGTIAISNDTSGCTTTITNICSSATAINVTNEANVTDSGTIVSSGNAFLYTDSSSNIILNNDTSIATGGTLIIDANLVIDNSVTNTFQSSYSLTIPTTEINSILISSNSTITANSKLYTVGLIGNKNGSSTLNITKSYSFNDYAQMYELSESDSAYTSLIDNDLITGKGIDTATYLDNALSKNEIAFSSAINYAKGEVYTNVLRVVNDEMDTVSKFNDDMLYKKSFIKLDNHNAELVSYLFDTQIRFGALVNLNSYDSKGDALDYDIDTALASLAYVGKINKYVTLSASFIYSRNRVEYDGNPENDRNGYYLTLDMNLGNEYVGYKTSLIAEKGDNDLTRGYEYNSTVYNQYENDYDDEALNFENKFYVRLKTKYYTIEPYVGINVAKYKNDSSTEDTNNGLSSMAITLDENSAYSLLPAAGIRQDINIWNFGASLTFEYNEELGDIYTTNEMVSTSDVGSYNLADNDNDGDVRSNVKVDFEAVYNHLFAKGLSAYFDFGYESRYNYQIFSGGLQYDF